MTNEQIIPSSGVEPLLLSVKQASKRFGLAEGTLRALIFHEEENGFSVALRRVGRRIFLVESGFLAWLENENRRKGGN